MAKSIKINLQWDVNGRINYSVIGMPDGIDFINNILTLSGAMFLCHQLGVLRPSYSLILCSKILKILESNNYILLPINGALKGAKIEIVSGKSGPYLIFSPNHSLFTNNDSLEEGVNQLISNYIFYINNKLSKIGKIPYTTIVLAVINLYLEFLSNQIGEGKVSPKSDKWNPSFSQFSAELNQSVARNYRPIDEKDINPMDLPKDVSDWIESQSAKNKETIINLEDEHKRLCKIMGIS